MKKVLVILLIVFFSNSAFAIEIINNEDTKVNIYSNLRSFLIYGFAKGDIYEADNSFINKAGSASSIHYGLQGNSRVGISFQANKITGQVELGAVEDTFYTVPHMHTVGFRQMWGAYTFEHGGRLLIGKSDSVSSTLGFSSDIFDWDGGINGFGGTSYKRRFQVQYAIKGFAISLQEDDTRLIEITGKFNPNFKEDKSHIPRIALAYTYNQSELLAKIGFTYSALNGISLVNEKDEWKTIHAFYTFASVKPIFLDGKIWVALQGAYDMNADLFDERKTAVNTGGNFYAQLYTFSFNGQYLPVKASIDETSGNILNVSRVSASAEIGCKINEHVSVVLGGGYQYTKSDILFLGNNTMDIHGYAVYFTVPYTFNKYLSAASQVSWYETIGLNNDKADYKSFKQTGVLAGIQIRILF